VVQFSGSTIVHYRVSFLKFLLSRERDVDAFCQNPRRKRRRPLIEVYPKGIFRPDFRPTKKDPTVSDPPLELPSHPND
jgi:hypothetical protein